MDYLKEILKEQKDYDEKVSERLHERYPTRMGRVYGKTEAMLDEILEIHQELKPYWQWWRGKKVNHNELLISPEKAERLIEEHIDVFKFLLSSLITLGVDSPEIFYRYYMKKHEIIHQRLEDAKNGNDNYLVSETRSLE